MSDDNIRSDSGSAFYLLRLKDSVPVTGFKDVFYISSSDITCYEETIGPIPLRELTDELPDSLVQIPRIIWNNTAWTKTRCRSKKPRTGDLIVCVEGRENPRISGGFYTTLQAAGEYQKFCEFVTWSSARGEQYGFVYCSYPDLHPSIIDHILTLMKIPNECT